jgi:hypothetical protein
MSGTAVWIPGNHHARDAGLDREVRLIAAPDHRILEPPQPKEPTMMEAPDEERLQVAASSPRR